MKLIQDLIEKKIEEAKARGEFDNLPGTGKPLVLEDDTFVPEELRLSYRMLKNSGFKPAELELKIELEELRTKLNSKSHLTEEETLILRQKLVEKESQFNMAMERIQRLSIRK